MSLKSDITALVRSVDLELYDTSIVNENDETIYRIGVVSKEIENEKRAGVSLDICVELTHLVSPLLDVTPPVSGEYRLEVGSPGIERKIATIEQFKLSIGEKVSILANEKIKYRGVLKEVKGSLLYIESESEILEVAFVDVVKAKTYFEW